MTGTVDLVLHGGSGTEPQWPHGIVHAVAAAPGPLGAAAATAVAGGASAVLWWHRALGRPPDPADLLAQPDDVWHAGLRLGLGGLPTRLAHVAPTWMLSADPPVELPATSWRLSLRACLARSEVIRSVGVPDPHYDTLAGAGLDLGHRWISHGARCRHEPGMVAESIDELRPSLTAEDELRFIHRRFGHRWAIISSLVGPRRTRALRALRRISAEPFPPIGDLPPPPQPPPTRPLEVSVIIPTVDRYDWLRTVLDQLTHQTVAPRQVIVVDQTPRSRRQPVTNPGLPLEIIERDEAGQSSARNAALARTTGDLVLFLDDDDDEIGQDLIARHAAVLEHQRVDVSSGVAPEPGDPPATAEFRRFRVADVFPTNNSLVRMTALARSGPFDPAFDHGVRADHELGTRLYLSGARMALSPDISVVHHRAPSGGLRTSGARRITMASARRTIFGREPISATELYLWRRHHPDRVRWAIRLRLLGNLAGAGPRWQRVGRIIAQTAMVPLAVRQARAAEREAIRLEQRSGRDAGTPSAMAS